MKKIIIAAAFLVTVLWTGTAAAQGLEDILDDLGGEIPVKDQTVRSNTAIEVLKLIAMLDDMIKQAKSGNIPEDGSIGGLLGQFAALAGDPDAILFGGDLDTKWHEVFAQTVTLPNGLWRDKYINQDRRAILTMQRLMQMIQQRQEGWETVQAAIQNAVMTGHHASGRNAFLASILGAVTQLSGRLELNGAIEMVNVNANAIHAANEINDRMFKEAQEEAFLSNFDREVPFPEFVDRGL